MFPCSGVGYWWIFPIVTIGMMALCLLMMRRRGGGPMMVCGPVSRGKDSHGEETGDSALDILNKRYARGEVGKEEYEEKKRTITT